MNSEIGWRYSRLMISASTFTGADLKVLLRAGLADGEWQRELMEIRAATVDDWCSRSALSEDS